MFGVSWKTVIVTTVLTVSAAAQMQVAHVKGRVFDRDGQPLGGATIVYHEAQKGITFKAVSDAKGEYLRFGLPAGTYDVSLLVDGKKLMEKKGFQIFVSANLAIDVRNYGNVNHLDFDLRETGEMQGDGSASSAANMAEQQREAELRDAERKKALQVEQTLNEASVDLQSRTFETALEKIKRVISLAPQNALAWSRLGDAYFGLEKHDLAIESYKEAVKLQPEHAAHHNSLGIAYIHAARVAEALPALRRAAELDESHRVPYLFNAAAELTNRGERQAAVTLFKEVIQAAPDHAPARYFKALNQLVIWDQSGQKDPLPRDAVSDLERYLQLAPEGEYAEDCKQKLALLGTAAKK